MEKIFKNLNCPICGKTFDETVKFDKTDDLCPNFKDQIKCFEFDVKNGLVDCGNPDCVKEVIKRS